MAEHDQQASWQIGDWIADPSDDSLTRDRTVVKIEPRLMQLLVCLARSAPQVVSIERLLTEVWSGVIVGSASVYQSVSQLRKVLGDTEAEPRYVETVARKGYRLIAPVRQLTAPAPAAADTATPPAGNSRARRPRLLGAGALITIAVAVLAWWWTQREAPAADSVVVLPFVDLSEDQSERPFCDGLTEEVSNWVAQLPAVNVVARTSAFAYRDKQQDVRQIGRQLGATHALEGSVRRDGDDLRVTIKLVATRTGFQVWAESYDTANTSILKVQEEIARAVATNLEVRMTADSLQTMAARRTVSDNAERMYLIARHHRQQSTRANNDQAIELFKTAIQADPDFALAYTGLASAYLDERYFSGRPVAEIAAQAEPLLAKAASLQPQLPDIYVVRAALETEKSQPEAARRNLLQAIRLNRNSVPAISELGYLQLISGEPRDALQQYTRAALLDPVNGNVHAQRCLALQDLAQFEEAAGACERARAIEPQSEWPFTATALLASARGRIDEALQWNRAALQRSPNLTSALVQRGEWLLMLGLTDQAHGEYQKAAESVAGDVWRNAHVLNLGFRLALARAGITELRARIAATPVDPGTAPEIKLLLAEASLIADDAPRARQWLDSALADKTLAPTALGSPWSARTGDTYQLAAAMIKARTGDAAGAAAHLAELTKLLDRMTAAGMRRYGLEELRAKVATQRANPDEAIRALRAAASLGWPGERRARVEPYFAALRDRNDYQEIIRRVAASNDAMRRRVATATTSRSWAMRWQRVAGTTAAFVDRHQHAVNDVADDAESHGPHHRRFAVRRR